jgi:hypothetical protein
MVSVNHDSIDPNLRHRLPGDAAASLRGSAQAAQQGPATEQKLVEHEGAPLPVGARLEDAPQRSPSGVDDPKPDQLAESPGLLRAGSTGRSA